MVGMLGVNLPADILTTPEARRGLDTQWQATEPMHARGD